MRMGERAYARSGARAPAKRGEWRRREAMIDEWAGDSDVKRLDAMECDMHCGDDSDQCDEESEAVDFLSPFFTRLVFPPPAHLCSFCFAPFSKYTCGKCRMVQYCSPQCQRVGWVTHKVPCKEMTFGARRLADEESVLKCCEDSFDAPSINYFDNWQCKLQFYLLPDTQPFCQALLALVSVYLKQADNEAALREAAKLSLRMLYHCRGDYLLVRANLPYVFLHLGMDQAAHDFMKWYEELPITFHHSYDFHDISLPFLHYWESDRSLPILTDRWSVLHFAVAEALVKYRLYRALLDLQVWCALLLGSRRPAALPHCRSALALRRVQRSICGYLVGSRVEHCDTRDPDKPLASLYLVLHSAEITNPRIWRALLRPQQLSFVGADDETGSASTVSAVVLALEHGLPLWRACPDGLAFLEKYCLEKHGSLDYDL